MITPGLAVTPPSHYTEVLGIMLDIPGRGVFAVGSPVLRQRALVGVDVHVFMLFGWNGRGDFVRGPVAAQAVVTTVISPKVIVTGHTVFGRAEPMELSPLLIVTTIAPVFTRRHTTWICTNVNLMSI